MYYRECQNEFTPGQMTAMRRVVKGFRSRPIRYPTRGDLVPLQPVLEEGRRPLYPDPEHLVTAELLCGKDEDGVVREIRENRCGSEIWCYKEVWK